MEKVVIAKYMAFNKIASSLIHEMKNPLSAITLGLEYIQLSKSGQSAQPDVFSNISSAVKRLSQMLENLHLLFTDIEGSSKNNLMKVSEILNKTKGLMNCYLTKKHISLEINLVGEEPWMIGNEGQLMTLFFLAMAWSIGRMDGGGRIVFQLVPENGNMKVNMRSQGSSESPGDEPHPAGDRMMSEAMVQLALNNGWQAIFSESNDGTAELTINIG